MKWGRIGGLAAVAALLAGCGSSKSSAPPATSTAAASSAASSLRGLVPEPFPVKPSFTLTDTSGRPYSFAQATRGKLTYLFFGYTHCPDACPATMSYIRYALGTQPKSIQRQVAVVFVTVDPARDSRPVLRRWLNHYGKSFVGLTGSLAQIGEVEHMAGVPTAILVKKKKGAPSYEVEHSSVLFVYSPDNRSHVVYATGFKPQDYAHDLPLLLKFR
jgi:protein SCO1/2